MKWRKLGIIYKPDGSLSWAKSHAMIPTPVRISDDIIRVFITFCDESGIGRPGFIDFFAHDLTKIINISQTPLLDIGDPGTFDENGVLACSVVRESKDRWKMYYAGFELGTKIRYRLLTGVAQSNDGGNTFKRICNVPALERSDSELFFRGGPYCLLEDGCYRLWYVAGSSWLENHGKSMPIYEVRYLESSDGIFWPGSGQLQIAINKSDEHGFGRPCVIPKSEGGYRMFYSIRRKSMGEYRLGYAESLDGVQWTRMDEKLNLDVGPGGFDENAIMYAAPIEVNGRLYVFYNGNNFGKDGVALAVLESE